MKFKIEDIQEEVRKSGWQLISDTYVNQNTEMLFLCPNEHENYYTFNYWRKHKVCPICKNNKVIKTDDKPLKKKDYRILACDQATTTSGWAIYDGEELISFGSWTSSGEGSTEKIAKTKYWFAGMIQKWNPDLIVLEDIQLQKFKNGDAVGTYKKLAHLQGVLKNYCYENGFIYKIVAPATWRALSDVKGVSRTEKKKSAQLIVKDLYDVNVTQDEADAILIGRWAVLSNTKKNLIIF